MEVEQLYELFAATIQPEQQVRNNAEKLLKQLEEKTGFLSSLLQIATRNDSVAQAGAIYFKNRVRSWEELPEQDRVWCKQHILEAISQATSTRPLLLASVGIIISFETKSESWPELIPSISNLLQSTELHILYTGVSVLLEVVKSWQWYQSNKRIPLNQVINQLFPVLLSLASKLEKNSNSLDALFLLKSIVKMYNYSIRMELSKDLQEPSTLLPWVSLLISVVEWRWDASTSPPLPEDASEREKHIWWKCKKWSYSSLNSLMGRYARARKMDKKYSIFSKLFLDQFAPKILNVYFQQISFQIQGNWCSLRVKQSQFCFLEYCIKSKQTWAIIQNHLEPIVMKFIFPQLCFSHHDQELWEEDPIEYVHKKVDPPMDDFKSPISAAEELLDALIKGKSSQTFIPIVTMINNALANPNLTPYEKYGLMAMMSVFSDFAQEEGSPIKAQLQPFLISYVFPELSSPHKFLKTKACDVIAKYAQIEFTNLEAMGAAFQHILHMINDVDLPIRVSASLALSPFLKYPSICEALKPHAVQVMQGLLNTTNEIDLDTLTHAMELLVFEFADELKPFATQLTSQLRETFMRIMAENNFSSDDVDFDKVEEKTMAAMGILKTLDSLILSVETSPAIILEIEQVVAPILCFVLDNAILDLYEETFEMIGTILFCVKQVSPTMWSIFPRIYKTFKTDALEYLEEMLPSLDNFIAYGKNVFLTDPEKQHQLIDIVFTVMNDADSREADRIRGIQLIESMMLNLRGQIDPIIPKFVEMAYHALNKKIKTAPYRVHCIEIVLNAIYYNPLMTLQLLEQASWTNRFFELWFTNIENFPRVHDKKLSILSLCALLEIPLDKLPPSLQTMWPPLFDALLKVFATYKSALDERKRIESGDFEDEDYGDYDDYDEDDLFEDGPDYVDDADDTIESLADEAATFAPKTTYNAPSDDDSDDEAWDVEEFLQEDLGFMTPLETVDAYDRLRLCMQYLISTGQSTILEGKLSDQQRNLLQSCLSITPAVGE